MRKRELILALKDIHNITNLNTFPSARLESVRMQCNALISKLEKIKK